MDTTDMCPSCSTLSNMCISPAVFIISILLTFVDSQQGVLNCTGKTSPDGTCFTLHRGPVTWSAARSACGAGGGYLASIATAEQQVVVRELLTAGGVNKVWLGASHTNGLWTWVDDNTQLLPQGCYNDKDTARDLAFEVTTIDTANINPERCISSCNIRGYRYAANQGGVKCFCGNSFGRYGTNKQCTIECPGWERSSISRWCGGPLMNFVYRINGAYGNWGYHQPNNHKGNQNCGIVDISLETKMADEDCLKTYAYICEITSRTCPVSNVDYVLLGTRCFFFNEVKVTWATARFDCQSRGGDLITIKSAEEFVALRNVTTDILPKAGQIWIGLNKGAGWQWVSGDEFLDPKWSTGYPMLPNTCAAMNADLEYNWVDMDCTESMAYVCQSDPGTTSTTKSTTTTTTTPIKSTTGSQLTTVSQNAPETTRVDPSGTTTPTQLTGSDTSTENNVTTPPVAPVTPTAAASTQNGGLSTLEIALIAAFSLLFLLLLIILIVCLVMYKKKKRRNTIYSYDARPKAPVPNSGEEIFIEYDNFSSTQTLHKVSR